MHRLVNFQLSEWLVQIVLEDAVSDTINFFDNGV